MLIDYHKRGTPSTFIARGRVMRLGRRLATSHVDVFGSAGELIATGRGKYIAETPAS
jgi:acyl-coenzyme A thioesterase PaaI-like protein